MVAIQQTRRVGIAPGIIHGALGGIVAGAAMALLEMMWSAAAGNGFWMPLQMIASVPLGRTPPEIALSTAIPVGVGTHMAFSMMFGWVLAAIRPLRESAPAVIVAASAFGLGLWIMNFFVVAPVIGRDWFGEASMLQQFVAHTFAFGTVLGAYFVLTLGPTDQPDR